MRRLGLLAVLWGSIGALACAQDVPTPAPQQTVSASYGFWTKDGPGPDWTTAQQAALGLSSRWGSTLRLSGQLTAPFDGTPVTADGLVQQLALTWNPSAWAIVTLGKQRLKWGSARVFSAIDGLEPVYDPLHPSVPLDGVTGAKAELIPSDWFSLSVLALPAPLLRDTKTAARVDVLWEEADFSTGVIRSVAAGRVTETVFGDFAQFFDRFGIYGEAQVKFQADHDPAVRATAGLQIDLPVWLNGNLTWLTEYHYNGPGLDSGGGVGSSSIHYGYTGVSGIPLGTEQVLAGASVLAGLDSGFWDFHGSVSYAVDQSLSLSADYTRFGTLRSGVASDLDRIPQRNQIGVTVSESF